MFRYAVAAGLVALVAVPAAIAAPTITETFDSGDDGWEIYEGSGTSDVTWVASGGNPGGFIRYADNQTVASHTKFADGEYVNNLSEYAGEQIVVDLRTNTNLTVGPTVYLGDADDYTAPKIRLTRSPDLGMSWQHYKFPLSSNVSHRWLDADGDPMSQSDFLAFLESDPAIFFRADYTPGAGETTDLDNVGVVVDTPRSISLKYRRSSKEFLGRIKSDDPACVDSIPVRLFRVRNGKRDLVASTTSEFDGRYSIFEKAKSGKYYTQIKQTDLGIGGLCAAAKSKKVKGK